MEAGSHGGRDSGADGSGGEQVTFAQAAEGVTLPGEAGERARALALGNWGEWPAAQVVGNAARLSATLTDKQNQKLVLGFFREVQRSLTEGG